jgi:hypothetical protein
MTFAVVANQVPVELFDSSGNVVLVQDGQAIPPNTKSILLAGSDGTNARNLELELDGSVYRLRTGSKLATSSNLVGKVQIRNPGDTADLGDVSNPIRSDPTGTTTQPISASSLPLPTGAATESTLSSIDGKATTIDSVLDSIKDVDGIKKITDALPTGDNVIGRVKITDGTEVADIITDSEDGINRLQIKGKVSVSAPQAPATATAVTLASDTPLDMTGTEENSYTITDGKTFTITSVVAGAEGDPTEKGSKIEVIFDQNGTEKVIDRIYLTGQTVAIYPDTSESRDGTSLDGNPGGTNKIILRRVRLSGSTQEVDAVLRGYEQ